MKYHVLGITCPLPSWKTNAEYPISSWWSPDLDVYGKATASVLEMGAIGIFAMEAIDVHINLRLVSVVLSNELTPLRSYRNFVLWIYPCAIFMKIKLRRDRKLNSFFCLLHSFMSVCYLAVNSNIRVAQVQSSYFLYRQFPWPIFYIRRCRCSFSSHNNLPSSIICFLVLSNQSLSVTSFFIEKGPFLVI